ncbi:MAG: SusC/RagA family TonB-linked outer membrane protein [Bacteroidota bacterium]
MKLIKTLPCLLFIVFLFPTFIIAQKSISGIITDKESGETLIGANVIIEGTSIGTATDIDGSFQFTDVPNDAILIASYAGYTDQRIQIGEASYYEIAMSAGEILDEVVVIGYGTVKKEDATGAIQSVSSEDFNKGAISGAQELLAGKIAGVNITTNSGAPGDGAVIRIRGGSSLSASNDPLIVIDGVPVDNGGISGARNVLNFVNPADIETFSVLKDASATAIYGSRASNGVILITTKKGSVKDKLKLGYVGNFSFSDRIGDVEVFSADQFSSLIAEQFAADHPSQELLGQANTDWQDVIFKSAFGHDHNLSASGAIGNFLPYRASLGYTNKDGILIGDEFTRTTASLNLSPSFLNNTLQININTKAMFTQNQFADRGAIGSALRFDPTQAILDSESPYGGYFTWTDATSGFPNSLAPKNPLSLLEQRQDQSDVQRYILNASIDYRMPFLKALRANLNLGYDRAQGEGSLFIPNDAAFAFDSQNGGGVNNRYDQTKRNELLEFYLNYNKEIKDGTTLDLLAGYSWQHFFAEDSFRNSNLAGTPENTLEGENSGELYLLSVYGRANLTLFDRLLLTATLRRDASSRFSPENRWGLFPAAAVAYKLIDNKKGSLNNLKLRVGYGVTGQQEIGSYYVYQARYLFGVETAQYQFGEEFIQTIRPEGYDSEIKWEETTTYNVGLDFGILNNRISGSVDYYIRETKDLLNFIRVPAGTNLTNFVQTNVGNLENKGIEISLNTIPIQTKDLNWEFNINMAANQNEITRLTATDDPSFLGVATGFIAGGVGNSIQIHSVGQPARSFFVFEQVYDENGTPIEGLYVDRNEDGIINSLDQYHFENPAPDITFGFYSNVSYKRFDLSFAIHKCSSQVLMEKRVIIHITRLKVYLCMFLCNF